MHQQGFRFRTVAEVPGICLTHSVFAVCPALDQSGGVPPGLPGQGRAVLQEGRPHTHSLLRMTSKQQLEEAATASTICTEHGGKPVMEAGETACMKEMPRKQIWFAFHLRPLAPRCIRKSKTFEWRWAFDLGHPLFGLRGSRCLHLS